MSTVPRAILTFDDGPMDEKATDSALKQILAALKNHGITGVFYLTGTEVKSKPDMARGIADEGHIIQSHSWDHLKLSTLSEEALKADLTKAQDIIFSATKVRPNRVRPPYGDGWVGKKSQTLIQVAAELGVTLTGWDIDTNDWNSKNKGLQSEFFAPARSRWKKLYEERKQTPLDILMHVKTPTARALEDFISGLEAEGWKFTTYGDAPQASIFSIQLFAGSKEGALKSLETADSIGFKNTQVLQAGHLYKLRVGPYPSRNAADSVLNVLRQKFPGAFISTGEK